MRQPWQIWLVFLLCLAVVVPAMGWLTVKTMQLDAARETDRVETELARREAELQERISSALYRMDLKLLPLVSQEAARPHYFYDPFYKVANPTIDKNSIDEKPSFGHLPSPLLFQPPQFVLLHFQIGPDAEISSPQRPVGLACEMAVTGCGVAQSSINANTIRLADAGRFFDYDSLLARCPKIKLPQLTANTSVTMNPNSIYNVPAIEKLASQIKGNQVDQGELENELVQSQGSNKNRVQQSRGDYRVNTEFNRRRDSTQQFAEQQWAMANAFDNGLAIGNYDSRTLANLNIATTPDGIREGVMQPMWIDEKLVLARRVGGVDKPQVQGCWLDWGSIQTALKAEVADLLPQIEFQPIREDSELVSGSALTTIPVQLVVDSSKMLSTLAIGNSTIGGEPTSGLRMSLLVAWFGLGLATLATAILLNGVIQLSERRATFVSAVTHELRTPLTTFRMYAEMMAEKMVPEGKQQEYANTLKVQADRLSHLVENVLQYARLEKGSNHTATETLTLNELFARFSSRLVDRANQSEMVVSLSIDDSIAGSPLSTQPSTIEQICFNLVDNACKYAKPSNDNRIEVGCEPNGDRLHFFVRDHGPGVEPKYKKRMFQPFCKSDQDAANSAEGVGLGLALCRRMASSLGGRLFHQDCDNGAMFVLEIPYTS